MRLIILLIVLAIGALLIATQLQTAAKSVRLAASPTTPEVVHVPTTPQGLPAFKKSINKLVLQDSDRQKAIIRKDTQ